MKLPEKKENMSPAEEVVYYNILRKKCQRMKSRVIRLNREKPEGYEEEVEKLKKKQEVLASLFPPVPYLRGTT